MQKSPLEQRIADLEQRSKYLYLLCAMQLLIFGGCGFVVVTSKRVDAKPDLQVLRARGLVIEDDRGRARVILGAPFPIVNDRRRKDQPTEAMVFLDEDGRDRLILGEAPDPNVNGNIVKRIAASFGVVIHDAKGNERGGFVWLANGRVSLALDRPDQDAWGAMVDDKTGFAGTVTFYAPSVAGRNTTGLLMGTRGSELSIHLKDVNDSDRAVFRLQGENAPSFRLFDNKRRHTGNLLEMQPVK